MTQKTIPKALQLFLNPGEEAKPIHAFPDYYITSEARVVSLKGVRPLEMSQYPDGGSDLVVNLRKNNETHKRSVKRIWADHFAETMSPLAETYSYLLEEYDDPEVHQWAKETLLPMCGADGTSEHWDSRYLQLSKD